MITVKSLSKEYRGYKNGFDRIASALSVGFYQGRIKYPALSEINFTASPGEILGLIGRNGAGKTTLLKVLAGVSGFQNGTVQKKGTLRAILELGVGFNPELSGKENIFYNGLAIGYLKKEVDQIIEEVFEFSGLSDFQDTPLKNYSSGMQMRLGFALATARRPEILLVDEALAVGDASFQQKCMNRFREFSSQGTLTIIVSHDLNLLKSITDRMLLMEKGRILFDGKPSEAVSRYMQVIADNSSQDKITVTNTEKSITEFEIELISEGRKNPSLLSVGASVCFQLRGVVNREIPFLTVGIHIDDARGIRVFGTNTHHHKKSLDHLNVGDRFETQFQLPLNLAPGKYSVGAALHEGDNHSTNSYLWADSLLDFELDRMDIPKFDGLVNLPVSIQSFKK